MGIEVIEGIGVNLRDCDLHCCRVGFVWWPFKYIAGRG
jgi:hypothetical protein